MKVKIKIPVELAPRIGCSKVHLYKINNGERLPSPELVERILQVSEAEGLGYTFQDLRPDWARFVPEQ
jgi:hypothetical protein